MESTVWSKLLIAGCLFFTGHVLTWFQVNSQFIWQWWKERPLVSILVFSYPIAFMFYYGVKYTVDGMGSLWSARLLAFGISFLSFPILTYYFYNESMFAPKTMICIVLSLAIVCIQVFMK